MSRIGKQIIVIPKGVTLTYREPVLEVKGPLGTLTRSLHATVTITIDGDHATLAPREASGKSAAALWGTMTAHVRNMVEGVSKGFTKKMDIQGVGFRAEIAGQNLTLMLGFSHPVKVLVPAGIKMTVEKNIFTITGVDKDAVGQFAASLRAMKKPEPYKGKGIRYEGEVVKQKQGKKATAAA